MWNLVTLCRFHHRLVHEAGYRVHVADPGATISFHRPDGTPIPHNPPPPTGRTDQLLAANLAEGPDITADTLFPDWDGSDPDYSLAVAALQTLATPR